MIQTQFQFLEEEMKGRDRSRNCLIEMRGIHKSFPGVHALKGVNFDLHEGEVHCLVGENGAGKSTLIKILSGVYHPDEGEIYFFGQKIRKINPYIAREMGISFIYQELDLFPFLTVGENIFLGSEPCSRLGRVNWKKLYCGSVQILDSLNFPLDVKTKVGNLTVAERQMVAVAKALCRKSKVLVMDEPSAVLSGKELDVLFDNIKRLKEEGVGIIYISHRLEEIFEIGDRVTVLRDGRCIDTAKVKDVTVQEITRKMVGREVKLYKKSLNSEVSLNREKIILSVVGLTKHGLFQDISFELRRGEVLGFAGLVGARRTEVMKSLIGVEPADRGKIYLEGKEITIRSPKQALKLGIGYVPENRKEEGLVGCRPVVENISYSVLEKLSNCLSFLRMSQLKKLCQSLHKTLDIKLTSYKQPVENLSGGNQQKVVLARWIAAQCKVLIFDEPTRGIDVGAKAEVHRLIKKLATEGKGIIVISSELPEVLALSTRILVMSEGRITAEVLPEQGVTKEEILKFALPKSLKHEE